MAGPNSLAGGSEVSEDDDEEDEGGRASSEESGYSGMAARRPRSRRGLDMKKLLVRSETMSNLFRENMTWVKR